MATAKLMERIINDTTSKFGGREALFAKVIDMTDSASLNASSLSAIPKDHGVHPIMYDVIMTQKERVGWIILFALMVLVAVGGNTIVIYIVSTNREMKSVTNYFLVNLSIADTMVSTLNVIFNFLAMLNSYWPFGRTYCKISNFIAILSIAASVFTLTAISCDRYNAIIYPLRPRMSHRRAIAWIVLIWTLSSVLAAPNLVYSRVVEDRLFTDTYALTCTLIWPDGRYPLSSYEHVYNILIMVLTYFVPILTMAILYYKVGRELWGQQAIGEDVEKQARTVMAKRKIVKMMIVVVIIFALCWLPYHGFFVINYYLPTIFQEGPLRYQRCYLFMYWLAMSNSMYNPIIIYFMNSKFRQEFKRALYFICCRTYTPLKQSINGDNAHQIHLTSGGANHHSNITRFANSNDLARRLDGNGSQNPTCSTSLCNSRLPPSITANRFVSQPRTNQPIDVIVVQSNKRDSSECCVIRFDREQEPFIQAPGAGNVGDCAGNNDNTGDDIIGDDVGVENSGQRQQTQVEEQVNNGGSQNQIIDKQCSNTDSCKVWI